MNFGIENDKEGKDCQMMLGDAVNEGNQELESNRIIMEGELEGSRNIDRVRDDLSNMGLALDIGPIGGPDI